MPRIDERSGDIIIRIVYDGMPEAGKTTNIQQLFAAIPLQRRGEHASPDTMGRRTEFFDWLDFAGGFVDGRRIRCQLVSVPGQPQLLHRRRYLLETADVVVFVADSQPASVEENRESVTTLVGILRELGARAPTSRSGTATAGGGGRLSGDGGDLDRDLSAALVIQANKQDLPGSLRPRVLSVELDVPVTTPVVPAVAQAGRGVMDTFVLAARLATDRVRALVLGGGELATIAAEHTSASALHSAMLALETRTTAPLVRRAITDESARSLVRRRANDVAAARSCQLPRPETLLAGHVWPPVKGRAAVATAMAGDAEIPEHAVDWAPDEPLEIGLEGWTLHSSSRWTYPNEAAARAELLITARRLLVAPELVPEGRALLVAADGDAYRLWMLTPPLPSLASRLLDALVRRDLAAATATLDDVATARAAVLSARGAPALPGGSSGVAMQNQRVVVLSLGDGDDGGEPIDEHVLAVAEQAVAGDDEARAVLVAARGETNGRTTRPPRRGG